MRRRQSGGIGNNGNQAIATGYQINMSADRPANLTNSYQESDKQMVIGAKGLLAGQQKIKLNSSQAAHGQN